MTISQYIENRFQELRFEESKAEYSVYRAAHTIALQNVLQTVRTLLGWAYYPKVVLDYMKVCMGLLPAPEPVLLNQLKAQQAEALEKAQAAKNVIEIMKNKPKPVETTPVA